jgi:hypothetical protein
MKRALLAIVLGGVVAGALDIGYAIAAFGPLSFEVPAQGILQSVAAGLIGREAAGAGGWNTALLGAGLHIAIAIVMAGVFVAAASRLPVLRERAVISGIVYGFILYLTMNYIVVPLSAAGDNGAFVASAGEVTARLSEAFSSLQPRIRAGYVWMFAGTIFAHTVLVGLPIALIAKRFAPQSA